MAYKNTTNKKIRVLMTAVGAPGAPDIIELLRDDPRVYILGMDINRDIAGRYLVDKFIKNLPGNHPNFSKYLLKTAIKEKINVVFPLSTDELLSLSKNIKIFQHYGIPICVSDHKTISIANDKAKLYKYFKGENFVPKYEIPTSVDDLEKKIYKMGFPEKEICIKPSISHGSRGFKILTNNIRKYGYDISRKPNNVYLDIKILMDSLSKSSFPLDILLSEYLPGEEWGIDAFIDPINKKRIIITRNNGLVQSSAIKIGKLEKNNSLINIGRRITNKLNFKYVINIDVKFDLNNQPKVIEINPRVPATIKLASRAGNNLPLLSIKRALGEKCRIKPVEYGRAIYFYKTSLVKS